LPIGAFRPIFFLHRPALTAGKRSAPGSCLGRHCGGHS
jgi:hypothetical protein